MSVLKNIESKIQKKGKGNLIFISDFLSEYNYEVTRKALQRLVNNKILIRLAKGIYFYPKQNNLLGIVYPSTEYIAHSIAKRDKARIIPTGSYALYKLGLSTQIPMNIVYLTDGSTRNINIGNQTIIFKKTSPKNLIGKHILSNLLIQGLKILGQTNISGEINCQLKEIIKSSSEADRVRKNIVNAPVWINKVILQILNEVEND